LDARVDRFDKGVEAEIERLPGNMLRESGKSVSYEIVTRFSTPRQAE